ncbi:MAG TPA: acetyl-CoA C-acetyltransferase [Gemmatimonadaceae bacterium]|jgi:acetyl-CoA C-acetyltransferase|nr:acetyl-CoA C-acetyltransferase [Gemmatimonadaceae bacterium]
MTFKLQATIVDAVRTPRGKGKRGKGALTEIHPQELFAQTLNHLAAKSGVAPGDVGDVVVGCVSQIGEQGANIARNAVLAAGWPDEVSATTINRFCGSGLQAVNFAAMAVASGTMPVAVGGGVESMSHYSLGADGGGQDGGNLHLRERVHQVPQGISADLIASLYHVSRAEVDAFALESQRRAAVAQRECRFSKSLFPVTDPATGAVALAVDEYTRPSSTIEGLTALAPAFADHPELDAIALAKYPSAGTIRHVHTAGNSSGIVDGAAAVLVASPDYVAAHSLRPRAQIRAMATIGSEPLIMLTAPTAASRKALALAGMSPRDIDLWEINEAFAVVPIHTMRELDLDPARVNVNGGAIALGHPLGATGAMLLGTVLDELERRDLTTGLVTLCIGGGQGVATIVERV